MIARHLKPSLPRFFRIPLFRRASGILTLSRLHSFANHMPPRGLVFCALGVFATRSILINGGT